jgi:hypothetical protein
LDLQRFEDAKRLKLMALTPDPFGKPQSLAW